MKAHTSTSFSTSKIIALFIVAAVAFTAATAFATKNYKSSLSNTSSIEMVNKQVGDILLRHSIGGAEINNVTDALAAGIAEEKLVTLLVEVGVNKENVKTVLAEFDKLGIGVVDTGGGEQIQGVSTPDAAGAVLSPSASEGTVKTILPSDIYQKSIAPDATGATPSAGDPIDGIDISLDEIPSRVAPSASEGTIKDILPSKQAEPAPATTPQLFNPKEYTIERSIFHDASKNTIQNIRSAAPEERANLIDELQASRKTFQTEILSMDLSIRKNAKTLRDNFRENVKATIGHVDHGKTARIAVAHGKGLRMVNRYRSAIARFDHILGRLESRIEKIGIEVEAEARANKGKVKETFPPDNLVLLIEEAKNTQALNKAKLTEIEAKYESLLLGRGENIQGVSLRGYIKVSDNKARAIAKELKAEIEKLHGLLDDVHKASVDYNSSRSNVKL